MAITKTKTVSLKDNSRINAVLMPTKADYFSDSYFEAWPKNEHWRQRLCEYMMSFGENQENLFLLDFCSNYNIPRQRLYTLRDKYPDIKLAFEDMMQKLGRNRCKKVPLQFVMQHDQYRYDSEWATGEERKAELSRKSEPNPPDIKVFMNKPEIISKKEMQKE